MNTLRYLIVSSVSILLVTLASCGGGGEEQQSATTPANEESHENGHGESSILKVGDKLFNVPSPIETAMLLEETGGNFDESVLNPQVDATLYSTKMLQAQNLGSYGSDLGYCLIYGQSQKAFSLLATCKKLGNDLGISPSLYSSMMGRFETNMENKDSLLLMVSELNRLSDEYLKENEAEDLSAMILYGGWIESMYFMTKMAASGENPDLNQRIGEQKKTIESLIGMIEHHCSDEECSAIVDSLKELLSIYGNVQNTYTWVEPETNAEEKLTVIKSKSSVEISAETMAQISEQISSMRNSIIGSSES